MHRTRALALLLASCLTTPALARKEPITVDSAAVKDKPAVTIDPTKAYLLIRANTRQPILLMKLPTPEEQRAYDTARAEAFARAKTKYRNQLKEYETARANPLPNGIRVEKPVEPTDETLDFRPLPMMTTVSIGPLNRFAKESGGGSIYLHEVPAGDYRIYGPVTVLPNGTAFGTCFCMGSVAFEAKAGVVTDLGIIQPDPDEPKHDKGDSAKPVELPNPYLAPSPPGSAVDPRFAKLAVVPAKYRPIGKLPNFYGATVARIPAMPGVMRYERDRIIDLTGTQ